MAHRKYGNRCSPKSVAFRRSPAILVNNMMMLQNLQCTSYFVFNLRLTICTPLLSIRANNSAMVSHFNVVYYVELSATARKFKMGEGGVQIDWCQIKNISHVFFFLHQYYSVF